MNNVVTLAPVYRYEDRFGELVYEVCRYSPKTFRLRRPNGNGAYIWDLNGIERVPYHLPKILSSAPEAVYITEGERDADCLTDLGFISTTAASGQWVPGMATYFAGRDVNIIVDNDAIGLTKGDDVARLLHGTAKSIRIVWLPGAPKTDVSDWFDAGHTNREFEEIISETPVWEPPAESVSASASSDAWPDPEDLEPQLLPVPSFDPAWLPHPLDALVYEISDQMQLPPDFAGTAGLVSLAGAINRRALVQPKLLTDRWQEPLNLWAANVGNVGIMKSPTMQLLMNPLEKIQDEWQQNRELEEEVYEQQKKIIELEQQAWEAAWKAAKKAGTTLPPRPDGTLWEPGQRRLVVVDATMEKLHAILADNAAGVIAIRDELVGFVSDLNKQGRESERAFWLQLANGKGSFMIDRIGRGTTSVPNVCASLFGNLVPARLRFYLTNVLAGGVEDDGFFSRILMCWPDLPATWKYVDRATDTAVADSVEQVYRTLTKLSGSDPVHLRFGSVAQEMFVGWLTNLERNVIRGGLVAPCLAGHFSKYRKFTPVIAAIFEMVERAVKGELDTRITVEQSYASQMRASRRIQVEVETPLVELAEDTLISAHNLERAIAVSQFYQAHAARVYGSIGDPGARGANSLAIHIRTSELDEGFTAREVLRHHWADLTTSELVTAAIRHLEDLHWVRSTAMPTTPQGGRPTERWEINPKIERNL